MPKFVPVFAGDSSLSVAAFFENNLTHAEATIRTLDRHDLRGQERFARALSECQVNIDNFQRAVTEAGVVALLETLSLDETGAEALREHGYSDTDTAKADFARVQAILAWKLAE